MSSGRKLYSHNHRRRHGFRFYGYGSYGLGGYYYRPYSYYNSYPYSYGYPYAYGGYGYYGGYPYYGYGDPYADIYPPAPEPGVEGDFVPPDGNGYAVESRGWSLLLEGQYRAAAEEFVREWQFNPTLAGPKVGYVLAAASLGDLPKSVSAMRRACDSDPESIHGLIVDKNLRPAVDRVMAVFRADLARNPRNADSSFLLAALQFLVGDDQAAGQSIDVAIRLGDRNPSTTNLKRVIDQALSSPDQPDGDIDRQQAPPPDSVPGPNNAIPVPPLPDNGEQGNPAI